jgi:hypothetical protein
VTSAKHFGGQRTNRQKLMFVWVLPRHAGNVDCGADLTENGLRQVVFF